MHRQIAGKLTGPVTKWIVLAAWLVIVVVASGFAAKLTDVQNNESSSWLPASAESTRALDKLDVFQDPNNLPTTVVYESDSGPLSKADLAQIESQAKQFAEMKGAVPRSVISLSQPRSSGSRRSPRTDRSPRRRSRSTSARTAGTRCRTPPASCATWRPSTA